MCFARLQRREREALCEGFSATTRPRGLIFDFRPDGAEIARNVFVGRERMRGSVLFFQCAFVLFIMSVQRRAMNGGPARATVKLRIFERWKNIIEYI